MKSKIALFCLVIILLSGIAYSQYYLEYETDGSGSSYYEEYSGNGSVVVEWYDVSDAEIEFCKNYGGEASGEDVYTSTGYTQAVSKLTITLQGQYTTLYDKQLYEIAWYVHPLSEDITYTVYLIEEDGDTEEFYTGYSTALDGDAGYDTEETDVIYTHARIVMEDGTTALEVPIVEKAE
jgi:hypothetical protein